MARFNVSTFEPIRTNLWVYLWLGGDFYIHDDFGNLVAISDDIWPSFVYSTTKSD